ncbi:unnamed protein product [Paramecium sonneborni]|uniref:Protein kinase domain-containing protein n=1 Tax=Paramecium sonneborni TaxID=65129 RepID=A0A8S1NEY6_9CILI|nr:unnamed protein product [Paramecium sonneborni]
MMKTNEMIQVENIQVKKGTVIGKGTYGVVYQAQSKDGNLVALKMQMLITEHEMEVLKSLQGKNFENLIQIFAFEEQGNGIYIIMELGKNIDLNSLPDKRMACLQMAQGVSELHKLNFFHRDLKPSNYVIGKDNKIKLIDFGLAKTIANEAQTKGRGTRLYIAPEVYITQDYDESVDIWSLGLIFYEIFTNSKFFETSYDYELMKQKIEITQFQINQKLEKQEKKKIINKQQKELLQKMIIQRLDNEGKIVKSITRPSIDEVINMIKKFNDLGQTQQQVQVQQQK